MLHNCSVHSNKFQTVLISVLFIFLEIKCIYWEHIFWIPAFMKKVIFWLLCWAKVSLLIGPALGKHVGFTLIQHVGSTLAQHVGPTEGRRANLRCSNVVRQRWPNVFSFVDTTLAQRSHAIVECSFYINPHIIISTRVPNRSRCWFVSMHRIYCFVQSGICCYKAPWRVATSVML